MVQRGSEARFAFETFEICFADGQLGGQHFDDESATELGIDGFIDGALSALTELLEDLVIPQRGANHFQSKPQIHADERESDAFICVNLRLNNLPGLFRNAHLPEHKRVIKRRIVQRIVAA